MKLFRFRLRPKTPWMSPWQADTIAGLLAALYARAAGPKAAEDDLIGPWRAGDPTLVVSDAFPGDLLPAPVCLAVSPEIKEQDRKKLRKMAWLTPDEFAAVQRTGKLPEAAGRDRADPFHEVVRMRNSIDRAVDSTGETGKLYEAAGQVLKEPGTLSVYARVAQGREDWAARLFGLLAEHGFGADAGVGAGEVELAGGPEPVNLEPDGATGGWVSLSTFQPAQKDPTEGYWRSFVKYGKLGPDFPVDSVFKRPQWMIRAGACFRETGARREWYGRWIPAEHLLLSDAQRQLEAAGVHAGQPAYALAVPLRWVEKEGAAP